jgi:hypothetical protein
LGLWIVLCASAHAATVHHIPTRHHVIVGRSQGVIRPSQSATAPGGRIAVPGWSEDATLRWMDQATGHGD